MSALGGDIVAPHLGLRTRWERAVLVGESSALLGDWVTWLCLSKTPAYSNRLNPISTFAVRDGFLREPGQWPRDRVPQVYVAFDDEHAVYVGQTQQSLGIRIKQHFGNQSTDAQREKAGSWQTVVCATWQDLRHGQLDQLEAGAADWVLPRAYRQRRRHPRA